MKTAIGNPLLGTPFKKGIPAAPASSGLNFNPGSARTRPRRRQERKQVAVQLQKGNPCRSVKGQAVVFSPYGENLHRQVCPLDFVPAPMQRVGET